jgi:hypothetical protein
LSADRARERRAIQHGCSDKVKFVRQDVREEAFVANVSDWFVTSMVYVICVGLPSMGGAY